MKPGGAYFPLRNEKVTFLAQMSEVRSYSAEAHEPSATDTLMEAFRADPIFRGVMVDDAVSKGEGEE